MATTAMWSELPIMLILAAVATDTTPGLRINLIDGGGVTAMTVHIYMRAVDFELGLLVMIETPDIPTIGRVAALAISAQPTLVDVGFFVTTIALDRGVLVVIG